MATARARSICWVAIALATVGCDRGENTAPSPEKSRVTTTTTAPRVITLTPTATEIVAAVGGIEFLVGIDKYSDHPASITELPRVGDFLNPSFEAIVRLRPTLVVADDVHEKVATGLAEAKIKTAMLPMHTVAEVQAGVLEVGALLGKTSEAQRAVNDIEKTVQRLRTKAAQRTAPRTRVLVVIDREVGGLGGLVVAGPGTYADELLTTIGAANAMATAVVRYPKLSVEQLLRADPDVVVEAAHSGILRDPADWNQLEIKAVASHRVHSLDGRHYVAPSPRVGDALEELDRLINGAE